ncbi:hypothetical protein IC620_04330 [Hazenella sp. IB182357]|uniref:Uncharacterized protein n=1 Tax=Polycladospora coralii TaxID=2771432 RepID=A0A926NDR5_9BACL|nr:hypothetical protein [Polycladospora coralii]MBD1371583.1 hypothetical protein [Polycladospora coralii]MBS7529051.1 hypothetical protein [Polycladospora coralii]
MKSAYVDKNKQLVVARSCTCNWFKSIELENDANDDQTRVSLTHIEQVFTLNKMN